MHLSHNHARTRSLVLAAAITGGTLIPLTMTGCLASHHTSSSIDGAYVQPSDLSRVRKHASTKDDVLQILGEPTKKMTNSDGTDTWTWQWTRKEKGSGHLIFIFNTSSSKEIDESAHVLFEYDVVKDKWRD